MTISDILVGVDGSDNALRAVQVAADLAVLSQAKVDLLFVVGPAEYTMLTGREVWMNEGSKIGATELGKASEILKKMNVRHSTDVDFGHPAEVILKRSERASMIVLGTRGIGAVRGMIFGSVSTRVSQHSKVPVLIVP